MIDLYDMRYIYQRRIAAGGEMDGYQWYIVSYGAYPCAYVRSDIPEKLQDEIAVHGSITFAGKAFNEFPVKGNYIGWGYNHYDDYCGCLEYPDLASGKKWTFAEIMDDVRSVIRQLQEIEKGY